MTPWEEHVARWRDCTACPLCANRTMVVLARGQLPCDVLMVGEAPGPSEDLLGWPFAGPAGHLLDEIIDEAVVLAEGKRPRIALTNLVACIPKPGDGPKFEEPPDEAVEACEQRLTELVVMARPSVLVCVGQVATRWLAPGRWGQRGVLEGLDAHTVSITHPAAILRANDAARGLMRRRAVVMLANVFREVECQS